MQEWIQQVIESSEFGILIVPASLLLGVISAVGSGCNVAVLGAVAGFAGSRESLGRRAALLMCAFFMLGTVLALALVGALVGHLSDAARGNMGRYGILFGGLVMVFFGLAALKLVPFKLPSLNLVKGRLPSGSAGAAVFGLAVGGSSVTCTLFCSGPLLPLLIFAAVRGQPVWGAVIMTAFAIGYSLPMAAIMMGVGLGRMAGFAKKAAGPVRIVAGVVLLVAGFWLLIGL